MEEGNFINFENSYKINENSYNDNFYAVVIRRKRKFIIVKKIGGVSGTLKLFSLLNLKEVLVTNLK